MTDNKIFYEFHPNSKRTRCIISLLLGIASIWVALHATTATMVVVAIVFAFGCLAAQVDQSLCIDTKSHIVSRKITLWGLCLRSSHWSLKDFTGIGMYRNRVGPTTPSDLVHVGLRRATGNITSLRYFSIGARQPCPEADAFAHSLEKATNLKLYKDGQADK